MNDENQEVMDRLKGKKLPPECPHCGKKLYQVYSREPIAEWDDKGFFVPRAYFGEAQELCCASCHCRLDDDLQREIEELVQ